MALLPPLRAQGVIRMETHHPRPGRDARGKGGTGLTPSKPGRLAEGPSDRMEAGSALLLLLAFPPLFSPPGWAAPCE